MPNQHTTIHRGNDASVFAFTRTQGTTSAGPRVSQTGTPVAHSLGHQSSTTGAGHVFASTRTSGETSSGRSVSHSSPSSSDASVFSTGRHSAAETPRTAPTAANIPARGAVNTGRIDRQSQPASASTGAMAPQAEEQGYIGALGLMGMGAQVAPSLVNTFRGSTRQRSSSQRESATPRQPPPFTPGTSQRAARPHRQTLSPMPEVFEAPLLGASQTRVPPEDPPPAYTRRAPVRSSFQWGRALFACAMAVLIFVAGLVVRQIAAVPMTGYAAA